jgi:hypothetical protein
MGRRLSDLDIYVLGDAREIPAEASVDRGLHAKVLLVVNRCSILPCRYLDDGDVMNAGAKDVNEPVVIESDQAC